MASNTRRHPPFRHTYAMASGARPIDPASSTETGFVGVLTLTAAVFEVTVNGCNLHLESPDCDGPGELFIDNPDARGLGRVQVYTVDLDNIHNALLRMMRPIRSVDEIDQWRLDLARELAVEMMCAANPDNQQIAHRAEDLWDELTQRQRRDWLLWLRQHPGFHRFELSLHGFFENGGRVAHVVLSVHGDEGGVVPRDLLVDAFENKPDLAMLCCPGLSQAWQAAVLEYAGPRGRGDLFAIIDGPPAWPVVRPQQGDKISPYATSPLATSARTEPASIVHANDLDTWSIADEGGFGAAFGPWLWVDNASSQLASERYVLVPPSGFVAGAIAGSDLSPNGGVHQPLTRVSIGGVTEAGYLFTEEQMRRLLSTGINPLLWQPRHGLRMATEHTLAEDTNWSQIVSRRCWLYVARSLRAGLQWAVQSSGPDKLDEMETTVERFLLHIYEKGIITGETAEDAWLIDRDEPDEFAVWVRPAGLSERVQVVIYAIR